MKSYSLVNMTFDDSAGLYDLFQKTVVDNKDKPLLTGYVEEGEQMRMDSVCKRLYGTSEYVEELKVLNNIMNEWTINVGDSFLYVDPYYMSMMRESDKVKENSDTRAKLVNSNKNYKPDPTRNGDLPPTVMPPNKKSVDINKDNSRIKIMNSFE